MKGVESLSLRYHQGQLLILDQTQLPHKKQWLSIQNHKDMIEAIVSLRVRGAPLIGLAAAFYLAQIVYRGSPRDEFVKVACKLKETRPTAVNLKVSVDRLLKVAEGDFSSESIHKAAIDLFNEDVTLCRRIAQNGVHLIPNHSCVLTHCNTGGLATAGEGTALGVIVEAHRRGKNIHVYVDETRPLLQGGRLTTWELEKNGVPYTLICDNTAANLMARGQIAVTIVGADRIARNGDFANKVGTYSLAVLCHYHRIPLYVAAPYTTLDFDCATGKDIPIEQRPDIEVQGVYNVSKKQHLLLAPKQAKTYNPAFDITDFSLVQGWIFDKKFITSQDWEKK